MASRADVVARKEYCPHCGKNVPKSTFYRHRSKFYDPVRRCWPGSSQKQITSDSDSDDFHFSDKDEAMEFEGTEPAVVPSSPLQAAPTSKLLVIVQMGVVALPVIVKYTSSVIELFSIAHAYCRLF